MNKLLIALATLMAFSVSATEVTYKFKCKSPAKTYINKLQIEGSVVVSGNIEETVKTEVRELKYEIMVQKAGFNSVKEIITAEGLKGEFSFIDDNSWTKYPFYRLSLLPEDRENSEVAYLNLLFNYPGKLNSFVRMRDGFVYKGQCLLTSKE